MRRPSDIFVHSLLFLAIGPGTPAAQDYGYAQGDVPVTIADKGAKVLPVLTKHPETGRAFGLCDGVAVDADGNVFFSEPAANSIYKVTPDGQGSVFYSGHGDSPNGLEFDPQGRLVACTLGAILRFNKDGSRDTLAMSGAGFEFKALNDITIGSDGSMFLSNQSSGKTVFHVSADGKTVIANTTVPNPDGVEWLEERKILYVADRNATTTWQFDVAPDGSLSNKRGYVLDIPTPDGITLDEREDVYLAGFAQGAVHLYSPGKKDPFLGHILVKGSPTAAGNNANQCFGGPDFKTLYITGNGGLFKIGLNVRGRKRPGSSSALFFRARPDPADFSRGPYRFPQSPLVIFYGGSRRNLSGRAEDGRTRTYVSLFPRPGAEE
ncbi:MAG: gluconolactonase [Fibrobacteres bacterium]|nr:gluconolactonase [Fibrobacterota bacterium]